MSAMPVRRAREGAVVAPRPRLGADMRPLGAPGVTSEILLATYWLAFCLYETVFAHVTIERFFYPFYLAFAGSAVVTLFRRGVRLWMPAALAYAAFLLAVAAGFIGFEDPVAFEPVQRVVAYLFGFLATIQVRSLRGLRLVAAGSLATSMLLSTYVIASAARSGFAYRGNVPADPNVVAFFIGPGAVVGVAILLHALSDPRLRRRIGPALIAVGLTLYASTLLASRGMAIALALALAAAVLRGVQRDPRRVAFVLVVVALGGTAIVLPGGRGLVERFEGERVESGGSRLPIWEATWEAYTDGTASELLFGRGFDASKKLVRRGFGTVTSTHNAYLQTLYEFGSLGLLLFVALPLMALIRSSVLAEPWGDLATGLSVFLLAASLSVNAADGFLYWAALGLVLATCTWAPERPAPPSSDDARRTVRPVIHREARRPRAAR